MPIDAVVNKYYAAIETMGEKLKSTPAPPGAPPAGPPIDPSVLLPPVRPVSDYWGNKVIEARNRLLPLSYSLDVTWRQRMQSFNDTVIHDPKLGRVDGPNKELVNAFDSINKTGLEQRLNDWLVEADPFKERSDLEAIAERGARVLEAIQSSYDIAAERPDTLELQPDLVAIATRVRERMSGFVRGDFGDLPKALSVPHQMYLELQGAIKGSMDFVRASVKKNAAGRRDASRRVVDWERGLNERIDELKPFRDTPLYKWGEIFDDDGLLAVLDKETPGRKFRLQSIFDSRDFYLQMKNLQDAIDGDRSVKDYVMKVRAAAWSVRETIDVYLHAIDGEWAGDQDPSRAYLDQTLCAVADRVAKQVNFVVTSQLAKSGPDDEQ